MIKKLVSKQEPVPMQLEAAALLINKRLSELEGSHHPGGLFEGWVRSKSHIENGLLLVDRTEKYIAQMTICIDAFRSAVNYYKSLERK